MQQKLGDVGSIGSTAPLAFFVVDPAFPNTRGDADAVRARGRARRAGGVRRTRLAIRLILTGRNTPRAPRATRRSRETRVAHNGLAQVSALPSSGQSPLALRRRGSQESLLAERAPAPSPRSEPRRHNRFCHLSHSSPPTESAARACPGLHTTSARSLAALAVTAFPHQGFPVRSRTWALTHLLYIGIGNFPGQAVPGSSAPVESLSRRKPGTNITTGVAPVRWTVNCFRDRSLHPLPRGY